MEQKALARWLKVILAGVAACGLAVYLMIIPGYGASMASFYPEFSYAYYPWLYFLWGTALPIYAALFLGWKIAANIGSDRSFTAENAKYLKWISWLAAGDAGYFFIGNIVLLFANCSHPGIALLSLLFVFAGIAVAVAAAALSHLVNRAADLQEQSDLTI